MSLQVLLTLGTLFDATRISIFGKLSDFEQLNNWRRAVVVDAATITDFISQKVSTKSFCESQFPYKSVNLSPLSLSFFFYISLSQNG